MSTAYKGSENILQKYFPSHGKQFRALSNHSMVQSRVSSRIVRRSSHKFLLGAALWPESVSSHRQTLEPKPHAMLLLISCYPAFNHSTGG